MRAAARLAVVARDDPAGAAAWCAGRAAPGFTGDLAGALAFAGTLALPAAFAGALAGALAETVFLALVAFADGFFTGILWTPRTARRTRDTVAGRPRKWLRGARCAGWKSLLSRAAVSSKLRAPPAPSHASPLGDRCV